MKKSFFTLFCLLALTLAVGVSPTRVQAQAGETPTPETTSLPELTPTPTRSLPTAPAIDPGDVLTFAQTGENEITLMGPYDSHTLSLGLPANWQIKEGAQLNLNFSVAFNLAAAAPLSGEAPTAYGGILSVSLNNVILQVLQLNQIGERKETIPIPPEALIPFRRDGRHELKLSLDSGLSCYANQQMNLVVHASSNFIFPYELTLPDTDLANFPRPLFQGTIFPESALLVLPDQPSAEELQSALTAAAGLGNLTSSDLLLSLATLQTLTPEQRAAHHLILVGKGSSLPLLDELPLPAPLAGGNFQAPGSSAYDGIVQMVVSPWNPSRVVLVVSGNNDEAVIKAAQALSTGNLRPNTQPNLALVSEVRAEPTAVAIPVDQTLANLGYGSETFRKAGNSSTSYPFQVPPGQVAGPEAYFEVVYSHSSLLNYDRSGMVILLNSLPVGSVRFSEESARQINHLQVTIPAAALLPGKNSLEIRVDLIPRDNCTSPDLSGLWATIWPESLLHLPLGPFIFQAEQLFDLSAFPYPFSLHPTLDTTAFILAAGDPAGWNVAVQLAAYLGDRANSALTTLSAYYGDALPVAVQQEANLLIVGRASQLPMLQTLADGLPAPFDPGSDYANERNMQVTYRLAPDAEVGYLELLTSPWNKDRVALAVLGSTPVGLQAAGNALTVSSLRGQLAGDFVAIQGNKMVTADSRSNPALALDLPTAAPGAQTPNIDLTPTPVQRPSWLLPALGLSLGVMLLVLLLAGFNAWRNMRAKK